MPATPARYGFIKQDFRHAVAQTPSVKTRHGNLARESEVPVETFFDNVADAQVVAEARQALLSPDRRRFRCVAVGLSEVLALDPTGKVPVVRYVDANRSFDAPALACEIMMDLEKQQVAVSVWG